MARRIEGVERLQRILRDMPERAAGRVEQAMDRSAGEIALLAKTLVPVASGELRAAIEARASLDGFAGTGAVGALAGRGRPRAAITRYIGTFPAKRGSPGWYAAFVEFGTAPRTAGAAYVTGSGRRRKSGNTHPGTRPQPFLFPAYWSLRRRVRGRIARAVREAARDSVRARRG